MTEITHEHGHAHHEIHLPPPSAWPLVLGLGFLVMALGLLMRSGRLELPVSPDQLPAVQDALAQAGIFVALAGGVILVGAVGGWVLGNIREREAGPTYTGDAKMAMWVFLGNEVLFFTGLIAAFLLLRHQAPSGADHALIASIPLVSFNTFVLLTSSLTVVLAHDAALKGKQLQLRLNLFFTILLGSMFVALQGVEYGNLYAEGLQWTTSGYGTAFFTLTGTHGLHVILGVLWCIVIFVRSLFGGFDQKHYGGVEIFGLYWHFVDIVWILLFTLVYLMHTTAPEPAARLGWLFGIS